MTKEMVDIIVKYIDGYITNHNLNISKNRRETFIKSFHQQMTFVNGKLIRYNKNKYIDYNSFDYIIIQTFVERPQDVNNIFRAKSYTIGKYYYIYDNDRGKTSPISRTHNLEIKKIMRYDLIKELLQ
jgi:hypothetical protein